MAVADHSQVLAEHTPKAAKKCVLSEHWCDAHHSQALGSMTIMNPIINVNLEDRNMIGMKSGFAMVALLSTMAGCTPAQYEVAYNQVVDPFIPEASPTRARVAHTTPTKARTAPPTIMATEAVQSAAVSDPVDFSQTSAAGEATQVDEKRFSEERDGGAGGGSGQSWGG
jgi:hypothetical protein